MFLTQFKECLKEFQGEKILWISLHKNFGNPLDAQKTEVFVGVNKSAKYRDIMFF